jgi:hypothetical protein
MKGSDLLDLLATHRVRVAKHEDEEVSLILVVGPSGIQIESLTLGEDDKEVFQQHLVALLLKKLDNVKLEATAPQPFVRMPNR